MPPAVTAPPRPRVEGATPGTRRSLHLYSLYGPTCVNYGWGMVFRPD